MNLDKIAPSSFLECNDASAHDAACFYAAQGLQPVKVKRWGAKEDWKKPFELEWQKLDYGTSEKASAAFKDHNGNIGIRGDESGLMGLDFDDGRFAAAMLRELPMLSDTLRSMGRKETGHYWVRLTKPLKNNSVRLDFEDRTKQTFADLRGIGGQIIVAPSIHPEGDHYKWLNNNPILPLDTDVFLAVLDNACLAVGAKNPYRKNERVQSPEQPAVWASVSGNIFADVKAAVGINDYLGTREERINCPVHIEQTPSQAMRLYPETQSAYCFSCGWAGDVIALHAKINHLSMLESAQDLAKRWSNATDVSSPNERTPLKIDPSNGQSTGATDSDRALQEAPTHDISVRAFASDRVVALGRNERLSTGRSFPYIRGMGGERSLPKPVPLSDFKPASRSFLVENLITKGSLNLLASESGGGKSTLATKLAACVASGQLFLGRATQKGVAIIFDEDNEGFLIRDRFERIIKTTPEYENDIMSNVHILNFGGRDAFFNYLQNGEAPALIVLDVMRAFYKGNENDSEAMGDFCRELREYAERTQACILMLHHFTKPQPQKKGQAPIEAKDRIRGSTAIIGSASVCLSLLLSVRFPCPLGCKHDAFVLFR